MSLYGANPEQLEHLGLTLRRQIDGIAAVVANVGSVLGGTQWMGPARDRFEQEWNGSFRTALERLNQAFEAAGHDCIARSQQLRLVMGA